jgi:hypothetical protein
MHTQLISGYETHGSLGEVFEKVLVDCDLHRR